MLDETIKARLFDPRSAFESPITIGILISIVVALAVSKLTLIWGTRTKRFSSSTIAELNARLNSWVILVFGIVVPILAGAATTVLAVWILCILCYREYANTVGILDNRMATVVVVFCSLILAFASIDHFANEPAVGTT